MSNSDEVSKEFKLSEEFDRDRNPELYDIIDKAYNILMENNKLKLKNNWIRPQDLINMLSISVIMGTISVYKKLQESENNNEISSSSNILDEIEYFKFIKAKLFSKIIDNEEAIVLYRDNLQALRLTERNGYNIKSRLALVNFQSEIIDLYERKGKGEKGDDAVNYKTLKEEEGEEGGKEKRGEEKRGGKRSRKSRKTKTAKKSRRTRRRRRN
mgnify:CR=1 FL=1|tara:strand:- start:11 stop:649 length:639 start_codon:yes stop_codon:yes gene_type:complete